MLIDHRNKHVLVTGAGSGIGRACALKFAECGAHVFVNDVNAVKAKEVAGEVDGTALPGDVANPGDWLKPVLDVGVLHMVVHNAGYDLLTPMGSTDMAEFTRLHQVMVSGPYEMTQMLLPCLQKANGACVVFMASVHGLCTERHMSAYASAKGAQIAMVRALCLDMGEDKIRAVSIAPGYIDTPLIAAWVDSTPDPAATRAHAASLHPMGRIGRPDEVAGLVAFLASSHAEFINGANVVIDGGLIAQFAF
ncbi:MAG TPA: SDR family oxidoreductase [Fimbriimonadaceae bacterium]|jgi:NAD(P)-dependent dehydrogenase (short-subunit alcohol dehydrogenase family)